MIPAGRYQKPWVVEQHIDLMGLRDTWFYARSFEEEADAQDLAERMRETSGPLETWRVRNRDGLPEHSTDSAVN